MSETEGQPRLFPNILFENKYHVPELIPSARSDEGHDFENDLQTLRKRIEAIYEVNRIQNRLQDVEDSFLAPHQGKSSPREELLDLDTKWKEEDCLTTLDRWMTGKADEYWGETDIDDEQERLISRSLHDILSIPEKHRDLVTKLTSVLDKYHDAFISLNENSSFESQSMQIDYDREAELKGKLQSELENAYNDCKVAEKHLFEKTREATTLTRELNMMKVKERKQTEEYRKKIATVTQTRSAERKKTDKELQAYMEEFSKTKTEMKFAVTLYHWAQKISRKRKRMLSQQDREMSSMRDNTRELEVEIARFESKLKSSKTNLASKEQAIQELRTKSEQRQKENYELNEKLSVTTQTVEKHEAAITRLTTKLRKATNDLDKVRDKELVHKKTQTFEYPRISRGITACISADDSSNTMPALSHISAEQMTTDGESSEMVAQLQNYQKELSRMQAELSSLEEEKGTFERAYKETVSELEEEKDRVASLESMLDERESEAQQMESKLKEEELNSNQQDVLYDFATWHLSQRHTQMKQAGEMERKMYENILEAASSIRSICPMEDELGNSSIHREELERAISTLNEELKKRNKERMENFLVKEREEWMTWMEDGVFSGKRQQVRQDTTKLFDQGEAMEELHKALMREKSVAASAEARRQDMQVTLEKNQKELDHLKEKVDKQTTEIQFLQNDMKDMAESENWVSGKGQQGTTMDDQDFRQALPRAVANEMVGILESSEMAIEKYSSFSSTIMPPAPSGWRVRLRDEASTEADLAKTLEEYNAWITKILEVGNREITRYQALARKSEQAHKDHETKSDEMSQDGTDDVQEPRQEAANAVKKSVELEKEKATANVEILSRIKKFKDLQAKLEQTAPHDPMARFLTRMAIFENRKAEKAKKEKERIKREQKAVESGAVYHLASVLAQDANDDIRRVQQSINAIAKHSRQRIHSSGHENQGLKWLPQVSCVNPIISVESAPRPVSGALRFGGHRHRPRGASFNHLSLAVRGASPSAQHSQFDLFPEDHNSGGKRRDEWAHSRPTYHHKQPMLTSGLQVDHEIDRNILSLGQQIRGRAHLGDTTRYTNFTVDKKGKQFLQIQQSGMRSYGQNMVDENIWDMLVSKSARYKLGQHVETLLSDQCEQYLSVIHRLFSMQIEIPSATKTRMLAALFAAGKWEDGSLFRKMLFKKGYVSLSEILRVANFLDASRRARQLDRKKITMTNARAIRRTEAEIRNLRSEAVTRSSATRSFAKMVRQWAEMFTREELEFFLLNHPMDQWRKLADVVHFHPSDFALPEFLPICFGDPFPEDSLLFHASKIASASDIDPVLSKFPRLAHYYSFLRTKIDPMEMDNETKCRIVENAPVEDVLWFYEELSSESIHSILESRLNADDAVDSFRSRFSFGKLVERIMMLKGLGSSITKLLIPVAEERLDAFRKLHQETSSKLRVAVLGDRSSSMDVAIQVSTIVSSLVSCCFDAELLFFNDVVFHSPQIPLTTEDVLSVCEEIHAEGVTSHASALREFYDARKIVDLFIVISDEMENTPDKEDLFFPQLLKKYISEISPRTRVVLVSFLREQEEGDIATMLRLLKVGFSQFRFNATRPDLNRLDSFLTQIAVEAMSLQNGLALPEVGLSDTTEISQPHRRSNNVPSYVPMCRLCGSAPEDAMFLDCQHVCACAACAIGLTSCPQCGHVVQRGVIQVCYE